MVISSAEPQGSKQLGIMHGGPFFRWQMAAGLVTQTDFRSARRCGLLLVVTWWLPILLLAFSGEGELQAFLLGPGVWARFLIAPTLFILAEPQIERSLDRCAGLIFGIPVIGQENAASAEAALQAVRRRTESVTAELVCALLAVAATLLNIWTLTRADSNWAAVGGLLTPAGWLCLLAGNTTVAFLGFRLVWRHVIWAMFLDAIARSDLRLVVSHPDGHAGLSFLTRYPNGYIFFSLGVASIVAAGLVQELQRHILPLTMFSTICTLWLVVVVTYFMLPLARLVTQIVRLKSLTIALALRPIQNVERAAERKALGRNAFAEDPASDDAASADAKSTYQSAVKCSAMLFNKGNIVPILAGALLPIAAAGLTAFPFSQLGPVLKRLLLL